METTEWNKSRKDSPLAPIDIRTNEDILNLHTSMSSSRDDLSLPENYEGNGLRIEETEEEKNKAETLTKEFSSTWTGDGKENLQKSLSQVDSNGLPLYRGVSSFLNEINGIRMNSYNNGDMNHVIPLMSYMNATPSMNQLQGFIVSSLSDYKSPPPEMTLPVYNVKSIDRSKDSLHLKENNGMEKHGYGDNEEASDRNMWESNPDGTEIERMDSYDLVPLPSNEMKRQRSQRSNREHSAATKLIRQNTETKYAEMSAMPHSSKASAKKDNPTNDSAYDEELGGPRVIIASVNGKNYKSEVKKKDKKDPVKWTEKEDDLLREAVSLFGEKQWKDIAERVPGRNHVQCLQRWKKALKPGLKKGHWLEEEDQLLRVYKEKCANWAEVATYIPGRTAKQCRERWFNHVDPTIKKGEWSIDEDILIVNLQKQWGNHWSNIAEHLPGRSENAVKIRWKTLCRRDLVNSYLKADSTVLMSRVLISNNPRPAEPTKHAKHVEHADPANPPVLPPSLLYAPPYQGPPIPHTGTPYYPISQNNFYYPYSDNTLYLQNNGSMYNAPPFPITEASGISMYDTSRHPSLINDKGIPSLMMQAGSSEFFNREVSSKEVSRNDSTTPSYNALSYPQSNTINTTERAKAASESTSLPGLG